MTQERCETLVNSVYEYHSQNIHTEKFTDQDISAEPNLIDAAVEYLSIYEGNFQFLLDIKNKSRGNLSVSQARGVLNTMLAEKRRKQHPLGDKPITGIVSNGFYKPHSLPTIEVKHWREDGTRLIRYFNTVTKQWDAFASINPDHTYRIWGKFNTDFVNSVAERFFQANTKERTGWQEEWSLHEGLCYLCGIRERTEPTGMCEECATGAWARGVVTEHNKDE